MTPVRIGMTTKLIGVLSSALILLVSTLSFFWINYFDQVFNQAMANQEQVMVSLLARNIDLKLAEVHQILVAESRSFPIADANDQKAVQTFLDQKHGLLQLFDNNIFFFDKNGRIVAESPKMENRVGQDFSHREYIQKTLSMRTPYISEPYLSSQQHRAPALMFTVPIFDEKGETLGVLAGGINLMRDNFLGVLAKTAIDKNGYFYLFNRDRVMIIHPDSDRYMKTDVPPGVNEGFDLAVKGREGTFPTVTTAGVPMLTTFKHLTTNNWILAVNHAREDLYRPFQAAKNVFVALLLLGNLFAVGLVWVVVRNVMRPLREMTEHVVKMGEKEGKQRFLPKLADDDLGALSKAFNVMLVDNDNKTEALKQREMLYRTLTEFTNDLVFWRDAAGVFRYISPNSQRLLGYTDEELRNDPTILDAMLFLPDAVPTQREQVAGADDLNFQREISVQVKDGTIRWFSCVLRNIDDENAYKGIRGSLRDVTHRKAIEAELAYLSLHDALTGLYNRGQFEREMEVFRVQPPTSLGVLVCDLNGLKLLNDTLGHLEGDKMLVKAAQLLLKLFSSHGTIARIGGDEFVIFFRAVDAPFMKTVCNQLKDAMASFNSDANELPLSFACGAAYEAGEKIDAAALFKTADDRMYCDKYAGMQQARKELLYYLVGKLDTLEAMDTGHEAKLDHWMQLMAQKVGYDEEQCHRITVFAKFHDIGKVGISADIWNKKGLLTVEERLLMQQHVDIGHHIASSVVELMPVADWILKHHEHWDGGGYPLGLAGDQIPEICRMFAVVEAYEAMTRERPYRQALSSAAAIEELARCRDSQFDPNMVALFLSVCRKNGTDEQV